MIANVDNGHRDQRRKDEAASPYIHHPLALARILAEEGRVTDPVAIAAALLHDTLEDTETTSRELVSEFGRAIADIVREVMDDKSLPSRTSSRFWLQPVTNAVAIRLMKVAKERSRDRGGLGDLPAARASRASGRLAAFG